MPILAHKVKIKDFLSGLQRGGGGQEYGGLNEGIVEEIKIPHHVYQRVNRRQQTFFGEDDNREYISLKAEGKKSKRFGVMSPRVASWEGWFCTRFGESAGPDATVSEIRPQREKETIF